MFHVNKYLKGRGSFRTLLKSRAISRSWSNFEAQTASRISKETLRMACWSLFKRVSLEGLDKNLAGNHSQTDVKEWATWYPEVRKAPLVWNFRVDWNKGGSEKGTLYMVVRDKKSCTNWWEAWGTKSLICGMRWLALCLAEAPKSTPRSWDDILSQSEYCVKPEAKWFPSVQLGTRRLWPKRVCI